MKYLRVIPFALLTYLVFLSSGAKVDHNITTTITDSSYETSKEIEKPAGVLSDDEILEKWRNLERVLKAASSNVVKFILRSLLKSSQGTNISSRCTNSLLKFIYGIKAMKLWAYKMIDSSGKIPNGILNGYFTSLGDFDGCLAVDVPGTNPFRGQYCTVVLKQSLPERKPFTNTNEVLPLFANFTKKGTVVQEMAENVQHFYHLAIRSSVCMPSTCSRLEIETIVDNIASRAGLTSRILIPTCDVIEPLVFSKSDIAIICVLSVIGLLFFVATVTDVVLHVISKERRLKVEASSTAVKCLMCFSAYTNTLRLLKTETSPDSIPIFHGMKVIALLWIMMNHTYYFDGFSLTGNLKATRDAAKYIAFQPIINGFVNVETFFFISAVLIAYGRMKYTGKYISIPLYIFRRVWRLTPPLMLIIATSMLTPHMGSGPGWKETVVNIVDKCKANWWTNLLFINNFIKSRETCYEWLWYIPVDTHLYLMALLVIIPLKSRPKLAHGINVMLFITGTVVSAALHVYYKHQPMGIYVFSHPDDIQYFVDNSYFRSYTHITTCCIGLYVGYVLATRPKLKIPKVLNILGWFSSIILSLVVVYGVYDWNQGNVPGLAVSTLYMCTGKVVWALALSFVTIACCTGNGGVITSILSWSPFVPLGRLTYVAYIIHPILQYMYMGSTRSIVPYRHNTQIYKFVANSVISYAFAYLLSLLFESPFMCLEKVMFSRRVKGKESPKSKLEENGNFGKRFKREEKEISTINIKKIESEEL